MDNSRPRVFVMVLAVVAALLAALLIVGPASAAKKLPEDAPVLNMGYSASVTLDAPDPAIEQRITKQG